MHEANYQVEDVTVHALQTAAFDCLSFDFFSPLLIESLLPVLCIVVLCFCFCCFGVASLILPGMMVTDTAILPLAGVLASANTFPLCFSLPLPLFPLLSPFVCSWRAWERRWRYGHRYRQTKYARETTRQWSYSYR